MAKDKEARKRKVKFFHYWQVRELWSLGLSQREIADELGIETREVRNYLKPMNAKTN